MYSLRPTGSTTCLWHYAYCVQVIFALAATGMCEGLGLGTNAMAALVTRGCTEMRKLVVVCGGEPSTVFGLSGVGDTFGTCFGPLSRNRQVRRYSDSHQDMAILTVSAVPRFGEHFEGRRYTFSHCTSAPVTCPRFRPGCQSFVGGHSIRQGRISRRDSCLEHRSCRGRCNLPCDH